MPPADPLTDPWSRVEFRAVGIQPLERVVDALFTEQTAFWPQLRDSVSDLNHCSQRTETVGWFQVHVRNIQHRIASTTAPTSAEAVRERPCFLCARNLPEAQRGIPFGREFILLTNPFPILDQHMTVVLRRHEPQSIEGRIGVALDLARALPSFFIVYNGPRCGASAPDHMHFQACRRTLFPLGDDVRRADGLEIPDYARRAVVIRQTDRREAESRFAVAVELLRDIAADGAEPMINVAVFFDAPAWTIVIFPRGVHRPAVFHSGELLVSPASIDLCGVFVVPRIEDFSRLSAAVIDSIFREVTLADGPFSEFERRFKTE